MENAANAALGQPRKSSHKNKKENITKFHCVSCWQHVYINMVNVLNVYNLGNLKADRVQNLTK